MPTASSFPAGEPADGDALQGEFWKLAATESEDAIFGLDARGLVTSWTPSATRLFGYAAPELIGRRSDLLFAADSTESHRGRVARVLAGESLKRLAVFARHRDGMVVPVSLTMVPVADSHGVCVVARDITERQLAQATLAESELRLHEAQQLAHIGLWLWNAADDTVQFSDELYRIHGVDPHAFEGTLAAYLELVHPDDRAGFEADIRGAMVGEVALERDHRISRPDGAVGWVYTRATVEHDVDGRPFALRGICQDITERKHGAEVLRRQAGLLDLLRGMAVAANEATSLESALRSCMRALCEHADWQVGHARIINGDQIAPSGIWYVADNLQVDGFCEATAAIVDANGGLVKRVVETGGSVWVVDIALDAGLARHDAAAGAGLTTAFAFPVFTDLELVAVVKLYSVARRHPDQQLIESAAHGAIQLGHAVERMRAREALARQALHDVLTDLPNRSLFLDRLRHSVSQLGRHSSHLAVIFIDLDNFKLINDGLGHNVGDKCLSTIAERLLRVMRPGDTTARFGGDEFMILCDRLPTEDIAVDIAGRLLQAISEPITLQPGIESVVTASAGIVLANRPDAQPEDLIRDADAAMYRAKEAGGARYQIFDTAVHERAAQKLTVTTGLQRAVDDDELRLVYQPLVRANDGALIGMEALVRWQHPEEGLLVPAQFVPIAERTGLIVPVGKWVLDEACRQAAEWRDLGAGDGALRMCVNVSAVQLSRPELLNEVAAALADSGIAPSNLCIEITESVLMADADASLHAMLALKMLGVSIAVDDFGTGYSSLAYLSRFPIDVIKIDKGFVDPLGKGDSRARSIVRAVVELSHALGVQSLAEGVETREQLDELIALGCEAAQGYLFARPTRPAEMRALLAERGSNA